MIFSNCRFHGDSKRDRVVGSEQVIGVDCTPETSTGRNSDHYVGMKDFKSESPGEGEENLTAPLGKVI